MKKIFLLIMLLSVSLFAQHSKDVPVLTPEQKIIDVNNAEPTLTLEQKIELLKLERDAAVAAAQAAPYVLKAQQANDLVNRKIEEVFKDVDKTKWSFDYVTLEFTSAPPKKPAPQQPPDSGPSNPPAPPNPNNR